MENQNQYLSYFKANTEKNSGHHRKNSKSFTSLYQRTQQEKILPHITEQFQFRITNQMLDHKIKHPKRDKIIVGSVSKKQTMRSTCNSRQTRRLKTSGNVRDDKENTPEEVLMKGESEMMNSEGMSRWGNKRNQLERCYKTFGDISSPCHNYMNDYLIALENNRMGRRLINVKSTVKARLTNTYYTYSVYNGKLSNRNKYIKQGSRLGTSNKEFGKINNGIKYFFQKVVKPQQSVSEHLSQISGARRDVVDTINKTVLVEDEAIKTMRNHHKGNSMVQHGYETNNPNILATVGEGQYSFIVNRLIIHNNPPIKPDALLVIQLIEGYSKLTEIVSTFYAQRNNFFKFHCKTQNPKEKHCFTSASFPYEYISGEGGNDFGIKFSINRQKEIYLRLLKNQGIEQRQLGVVKIDLESYFNPTQESQFPVKVMNHYKEIQGEMHFRKVYQSSIEGKLAKLKKGETATSIQLDYQFYHKRYQKMEAEAGLLSSTEIIEL